MDIYDDIIQQSSRCILLSTRLLHCCGWWLGKRKRRKKAQSLGPAVMNRVIERMNRSVHMPVKPQSHTHQHNDTDNDLSRNKKASQLPWKRWQAFVCRLSNSVHVVVEPGRAPSNPRGTKNLRIFMQGGRSKRAGLVCVYYVCMYCT